MNFSLFEDNLVDAGIIVEEKDGEHYETSGMSVTFKVTSDMTHDQMGIYEIVLNPHTIGAKLHYHRFMDETFIVTEGKILVQLAQRTIPAKKGDMIYVPRLTPHGFRNDSNEPARLNLIFSPGQQREGFFKGLYMTLIEKPVDETKFLKLYHKYDSFPVDETNMIQTTP